MGVTMECTPLPLHPWTEDSRGPGGLTIMRYLGALRQGKKRQRNNSLFNHTGVLWTCLGSALSLIPYSTSTPAGPTGASDLQPLSMYLSHLNQICPCPSPADLHPLFQCRLSWPLLQEALWEYF